MLTIVAFSFIVQGVMLATILWNTSCFRTRTQQTPYIAPMLGQRRIRWPNVNPTLGQCLNKNYSCQFKSFCLNSSLLTWAHVRLHNNAGVGYFMQYI